MLISFRKRRLITLALVLAAVLVAAGVFIGRFLISFPPHQTGSSQRGWQVVASPNSTSAQNGLYGVATIAANDVWAVGTTANSGSSGTIVKTLIEHWNGRQWSVVQSPNSSSMSNVLNGIAGIAANDVWAVGYSSNTSISPTSSPPNPSPAIFLSGTHTLIEHWDGTQWNTVQSPNPGSALNYLNAVAAITANNIWAVGFYSNTPNIDNPNVTANVHTLIEHWNGTQWSIVQSPNSGSIQNGLYGVTASTANNIWAVGTFCCPNNQPGEQTLIEHWNGTQWSIVQGPSLGMPQNFLFGVAASTANDVWAVGGSSSTSRYPQFTLIEHWNGKQWSVVSSPSRANAVSNSLNSVVVIAANDVWTVGYSPNIYPQQGQTLIEHWDGTQWSIVNSPSPGRTNSNYLYGAARVSHSSTIWAVGFVGYSFTPVQTITEVWNS